MVLKGYARWGGWPRGKLAYWKTYSYCEGIHPEEVYDFNFELVIVLFLETQVVLVPSANTGKETYKKLRCLYVPTVQFRVRNGRGGTGVYYRVIPKELAQAEGTRH